LKKYATLQIVILEAYLGEIRIRLDLCSFTSVYTDRIDNVDAFRLKALIITVKLTGSEDTQQSGGYLGVLCSNPFCILASGIFLQLVGDHAFRVYKGGKRGRARIRPSRIHGFTLSP
jgi:hypothetical protein